MNGVAISAAPRATVVPSPQQRRQPRTSPMASRARSSTAGRLSTTAPSPPRPLPSRIRSTSSRHHECRRARRRIRHATQLGADVLRHVAAFRVDVRATPAPVPRGADSAVCARQATPLERDSGCRSRCSPRWPLVATSRASAPLAHAGARSRPGRRVHPAPRPPEIPLRLGELGAMEADEKPIPFSAPDAPGERRSTMSHSSNALHVAAVHANAPTGRAHLPMRMPLERAA